MAYQGNYNPVGYGGDGSYGYANPGGYVTYDQSGIYGQMGPPDFVAQGYGPGGSGQGGVYGQAAVVGPGNVFGPPPNFMGQGHVYGQPGVMGQENVYGQPTAMGQGNVCGQPTVMGPGHVYGQPNVIGQGTFYEQPGVMGQANVYGQPNVMGQANVYEQPNVMGQGNVYGQPNVMGQGIVYGQPNVIGQGTFYEQPGVMGQANVYGQPDVVGKSGNVHGQAVGSGQVGNYWQGGTHAQTSCYGQSKSHVQSGGNRTQRGRGGNGSGRGANQIGQTTDSVKGGNGSGRGANLVGQTAGSVRGGTSNRGNRGGGHGGQSHDKGDGSHGEHGQGSNAKGNTEGKRTARLMQRHAKRDDNWECADRHNLMQAHFMDSVPENFEEDWVFIVCPSGRRRALVAAKKTTQAYNNAGKSELEFRSCLPNGSPLLNFLAKPNDLTILDTVYSEEKKCFYVIDLLHWKHFPYYETEAEVRFFCLQSKYFELKNPSIVSDCNEYSLSLVQKYSCTKSNILQVVQACRDVKVDGLLFYKLNTGYRTGETVDCLWLKLDQMQSVLGVRAPEGVIFSSTTARDEKRKAEQEERRKTWASRIEAEGEAENEPDKDIKGGGVDLTENENMVQA